MADSKESENPAPLAMGLARSLTLPLWLRYALALVAVALAFVTRLSLDSVFGQEHQPFATFYVAVAVTAWLCGLGPALVSLVLGLFVSVWAIIPPRDSLILTGRRDLAEILIYCAVCGTVVVLIELLRRSRRDLGRLLLEAREGQRQLAADIVERQKVEEALRRTRQELADANAGLERTVQERTARLREAMSELEHFSYSIVHDMRAPLRAMQSYAGFLEEEQNARSMTPEAREYLRRIRVASQRMDLLITDALSYSKVVREELPLKPVDLGRLLRSLLLTYPSFETHQSAIHLAPNLPVVRGNEAALTQCFGNLLDNALKFAAPGRPPHIEVWAETNNGLARVFVRDNGIGIAKEALPRLFRMFERLQHKSEGTGIGLALVRKVAQRMGGQVGVDSRPGQGSCFWVELPTAVGQPVQAPSGLHPSHL